MSVLVLDPVPTNLTLLDVALAHAAPAEVMNRIINRLANPPAMIRVKSELVDQFGHPIWVEKPYADMLTGMTWKEWIDGK